MGKLLRTFSEWLWDKAHPEPCRWCKEGECYEHKTFPPKPKQPKLKGK